MEEGKINSLTGMRGLFAIAILLFHWGVSLLIQLKLF